MTTGRLDPGHPPGCLKAAPSLHTPLAAPAQAYWRRRPGRRVATACTARSTCGNRSNSRSLPAYTATPASPTAPSTAAATTQPPRPPAPVALLGGGAALPPPLAPPPPPPGPMCGSTGMRGGCCPSRLHTLGLVRVHCQPGSTCRTRAVQGSRLAQATGCRQARCARALPGHDQRPTLQAASQPSSSSRSPSSHSSSPSSMPAEFDCGQEGTARRERRLAVGRARESCNMCHSPTPCPTPPHRCRTRTASARPPSAAAAWRAGRCPCRWRRAPSSRRPRQSSWAEGRSGEKQDCVRAVSGQLRYAALGRPHQHTHSAALSPAR